MGILVQAQSSIGSIEYRIKTKIEKEQKKHKNPTKQNFGFCWDGEGSRTSRRR
jgi:hypothetical protein